MPDVPQGRQSNEDCATLPAIERLLDKETGTSKWSVNGGQLRTIATVPTEADLPRGGLRQLTLVAGRDPWEDLPAWMQESSSGDTEIITGFGIQASGWGWELQLSVDVTCNQPLLHGETQVVLSPGEVIRAGTPVDCSLSRGHIFTEAPEESPAPMDFVYITQDTGHLWEWDGQSWTRAGPFRVPERSPGESGFYVAPGYLSDHTSMLQNSIDNLAANGGGQLTLQRGTFQISSTVVLKPGVSLHGSGQAVTTIDSTHLPADTVAIHVAEDSIGAALSDFTLRGSNSRDSIGIHFGGFAEHPDKATVDFTVANLRVESFHRGITARFAWCGVFTNVRVHICRTSLEFGSQVNAIKFNGWLTSFTESAAILTNVEGITFDTTSFESSVSTRAALTLFQSQVVLVQPYVEFVSRFAQVGYNSEDDNHRSTLASVGGRLCGTIVLGGRGTQITITSPWLISSPPGTPLAIDMEDGNFGAQPKQVRVDAFEGVPGIKQINEWDCRAGAWTLQDEAEGMGITAMDKGTYFKVASLSVSHGIHLGALEVGEQYVLSYRARKADGDLLLQEGNGEPRVVAKVESPTAGFQVVHTPFIARDTSLRMLWGGELDLQWISLVKGLHFLDRHH